MSSSSDAHLVWMDLEMTGLAPERDTILEIATLITTNELQLVAEGPVFVVRHEQAVLEAMDEWNRKHHGASGLSARVIASTTSLADAEAQTLAFVQQYCPQRVVRISCEFDARPSIRRCPPCPNSTRRAPQGT